MSTTTDNTTASIYVALTDGALACASCGVAVPADEQPDEPVTETSLGREGALVPNSPDAPRPTQTHTFTRCPSCADRDEAVRLILDDVPEVVVRLDPEVAHHRLGCALDAIAATGGGFPRGSDLTAAEVNALIRHLTGPGADTRWSSRFAPLTAAGARPGTAALGPWAHVTEEARAAVRQGRAAVLRERVARSAPDEWIEPPEGTGCMFCGVGHITVSAQRVAALGGRDKAAEAVWRVERVNPRVLGGPPAPQRLTGALCGPCAAAVDTVGSIGHTAMERAYVEHLREQGEHEAAKYLGAHGADRMTGWSGLGTEEPNPAPWEHLVYRSGEGDR